MPDHNRVAAFVDRIVAGAHIPSRAGRDDLRRELHTHFEEAGDSPEAVEDAMRRFGAETMIAESLRYVYRWDFVFLYFAKIAASIVASTAAALVIQVLVNLRVEVEAEVWRLAPGFSRAALLSVGVVLGLITAWEIGRRPFSRTRAAIVISAYAAVCVVVQVAFAGGMGRFVTATMLVGFGYVSARLQRWPAKLLLAFAAFGVTLYLVHLSLSVTFGPVRAALTSGVHVAVWASTVLILGRLDRAFVSVFERGTRRTAL